MAIRLITSLKPYYLKQRKNIQTSPSIPNHIIFMIHLTRVTYLLTDLQSTDLQTYRTDVMLQYIRYRQAVIDN